MTTQEIYQEALDSFVEKVKTDKSVIAVVLCGSMAYDTVWEKSDIDLEIVVRDQQLLNRSYCADENDIIINAEILTRSEFVRTINRSGGGSFMHGFLAKGKIIFSTDESLNEQFEEFKIMGSDDIELSLFFTACELVSAAEKIEKWLKVKHDVTYAKLYILKAAEPIARMEIIRREEIPTREVLQRAAVLSPALINKFYFDLIDKKINEDEAFALLGDIHAYLAEQSEIFKRPVTKYLSNREPKTVTMFKNHFKIDSHFIEHILEYLCEQQIIAKVTETIRITPKGRKAVEEVAYMLI